MPVSCAARREFGREYCEASCPAILPGGPFLYARVEAAEDLPAADPHIVDVAVLDMNHGWPNMGHDSLVHSIRDTACDLAPALRTSGLRLRAISFDVRRSLAIPELPGGRFQIYLGTGGPGHLDPHMNDGVYEGAQGILENPAWETPLFALFDSVRADPSSVLFAVCHTFGVLCRWAGIAEPVLRGEDKGGKSSGVLENILTEEAVAHPWFGRFAAQLPDGRRLRILDSRLYDLVPISGDTLPDWIVPLGYEASGVGGPAGDALTMIEMARDRGGVVPRIFAVNHHPEIFDRFRQLNILKQKFARREVPEDWYEERLEILTKSYPDEDSDRLIDLTSDYTLIAPLQFHLYRQVRERAQALGFATEIDEETIADRMRGVPVAC